jgi:hypothetical protein
MRTLQLWPLLALFWSIPMAVAGAGNAAAPALRTWTNTQGRIVQAIFAGEDGGVVLLKLATGQVSKVPLESLSKADQDHVALLRLRHQAIPAQFPEKIEVKPHPGLMQPPATSGWPAEAALESYDAGSILVTINRHGIEQQKEADDQRAELFRPLIAADWLLGRLPGLPPRERVAGMDLPHVLCVPADQYERWGGISKSAWTITQEGRLLIPWSQLQMAKDAKMPPATETRSGDLGGGVLGTEKTSDTADSPSIVDDPRLKSLLPGIVALELAEDTLFLPPWVREGILECARHVPQEKGWPQPARLGQALLQHLDSVAKFGGIKLDAALAAETLNLSFDAWADASQDARTRRDCGALLLVYYFMNLDSEALSAWQSAWALAHADALKLHVFRLDTAKHRAALQRYVKENGIVVNADGAFNYPVNNPPPIASEVPFPELKNRDYAALSMRYDAVLRRALGDSSGVEKLIADAYSKAGIPLGGALKDELPEPAVASRGNGSIVESARRLPVDNRTWPLQIKVGVDAVLAYEVARDSNRYRCGRFEFQSNAPLSLPVVKEVARTFTAVEQLVRQLPWGITPTPGGGEFFQARLFSTRYAYEDDGGPPLSGGVYSRKDKIFRVPFQSLGIEQKNGNYVKAPGFNVGTLVHELTHMMMDEMLPSLPIWVAEGSAEYTNLIPFKDGLFRFGDHLEGLKVHIAEFVKDDSIPTAEDCVKILHLAEKDWHKAVERGELEGSRPLVIPVTPRALGVQLLNPTSPNRVGSPSPREILTQRRLYCGAALLFYFFMHLDEPKRGHPMLPFLDAVQDDLPKMREFTAAVTNYERLMVEFMKQPGVEHLGGGRFKYPPHLKPPEAPALPSGVSDAGQIAFIHLDLVTKGRTDAQIAEDLRKKFLAVGIKL